MNSAIGFTAIRRGSEQEKARANAALRKALSHFPDLAQHSLRIGETDLVYWGRDALESCVHFLPDQSILLLTGSPAGTRSWEEVEKQILACRQISDFRIPWDGRVNLLHITADGRHWTLWNDFIGAVPVYHSQANGSLIASTLEPAVVEARCFTKESFDFTAVVFFLIHGHFFRDWTLYREMKKVLPDCVFEWTEEGTRLARCETVYASNDRFETRYDRLIEELHSQLKSAVKSSLSTSSSWILPISGGMDSRMIGAASAGMGLDIQAFTWGTPNTKDVIFAQRIAKTIGIPWQRIDPGIDYLKDFLPPWRDLFGSSMHFHGMYQMPFYDSLKGMPPAKITSGFINDVLSGYLTGNHTDMHPQGARMLYTLPEYYMFWKEEDLRKLFPFPIDDTLDQIANSIQAELDAMQGNWYQKLMLLVLRGRQHHFTHFQSMLCDYWRGAGTPYINRSYANFWFSLPRPLMDNRMLLMQMAKRYYSQVMEVPVTRFDFPASITGRYLIRRRISRMLPQELTRRILPEFAAEKQLTTDVLSLKRWGKEAVWPIPEMREALGKWMNLSAIDHAYEKALDGDIASVRKLQTVQTLAYRMMD